MTSEKKTSPFRTDPETGKPWSEVHNIQQPLRPMTDKDQQLMKRVEPFAYDETSSSSRPYTPPPPLPSLLDVDLKTSYAGVKDAEDAVAAVGEYIAKTAKFVAPLAVEVGAPLVYGIAASPLLIAPVPGARVAYFGGLGAVGSGSNALAQAMRIGFGDQDEWSWEENIAATGFSFAPGFRTTKDLSKAATVALRAGEGAVMATGETATRQALEMGSGKRKSGDWDTGELGGTAAFGSVLGGVLGRLEKAMIKATPKEMANPMLRRALRDELKIAKKLLKEYKGEEDLVKASQKRIDDVEKQIQDLAASEEKILQKAIDHLDEQEAAQIKAHQEAALDFQNSDVAKRLKESDDRQWAPKTDAPLLPVKERLPNRLRQAAPRYSVGEKHYGLEFDNDVDKALFIVRNRKNKSKADKGYMDFLRKVLAGKTDDEIRSLGDRISNELIKPEAMTGSGGTKLSVSRFHGVAEALGLPQSTKVETSAVIDPKEKTPSGPIIDPRKTEGTGDIVDARGRKILDDFMSGEGTRDIDAETGKLKDSKDEIKARLLSSDEDVQRLVNVTQDAIVDDLKNIKGRQSKLQYLARVQEELNRRIGGDVADEFGIVLKAAQLTDDMEVADALDKLTIHMGANAMTLTSRLADIPKMLQDADLDDPEVVNNALVAIARTINPILANKKAGSASGRNLQSRKFTKDAIEVQYKKIEEAMEERLVSELKTSDKLTPEQLKEQVETFGDIQIVKRLLKAVQQAEDIGEVKKILMDQQQAFQDQTTFGKFMSDNKSRYVKVRDVMTDALYSSMLSSPITPIKAALGNAIMTRYHPFMGRVGAKYMAVVPWARRGMTKQQWEDAGAFWKKVGMSYSHFNDLALKEAQRAFKSGDADFRSHFERIGGSALAMERTGLSGALGQSLENAGQFVDIPGKTLAAIDARTKTRVAHAMTVAKAQHDYTIAKRKDPDSVPDSFDEYYQNFLQKVFNEDGNKLMTEDQVRRQAVVAAEAEGVAPEKLGDYIENYVKTNWDKSTSDFVSYVERNAKEITFQEELGEFTDANRGEKGLKKFESIIRDWPLLQVTLFPFMRTGRNIIREGLSTTSILAETPWIGQYIDGIWAKTTQDLNSGDPIVMARAKGRQVVGAGIISSMIALAKSGVLVGNEEQNWKKKENLNVGTGLGDYEVRLPLGPNGERVGLDYTALEPFATVAGIVADGVKLMEDGTGEQELLGSTLIHAAQTVVSNNIGNKSYFKNLGTALKLITVTSESADATEAQRLRMIKSFASPLAPSGMNALELVTDNERRRGDQLLQVLGKRIAGIAKTVPPYRDMFGDIIPIHGTDFTGEGSAAQGFSLFNPVKFRKERMNVDNYVKEDKNGFRTIDVGKINLKDTEAVRNAAWAVAIELDGEYQFNGGTPIKDGVDLQTIVHEETGKDAFERWQEIYQTVKNSKGHNVKQAIVSLAKMEGFKKQGKLPPNKVPEGVVFYDGRPGDVNGELETFRALAFKQLQKEYPILRRIEEDSFQRNKTLTFEGVEKALDQSERQAPLEAYEEEGRPPTRLQQLINPINLINNN